MSLFFSKIKLADSMIVGWDFEVFAVLTNNCMEARTCSFLFLATAVGYNGKLGGSCGLISEKVEVPPGEGQQTNTSLRSNSLSHACTVLFYYPPPEKRLSLTLEYERYRSKITSDRLIQLSAITIDKHFMDFHKAEKTIVLDEPDIQIKVWFHSWELSLLLVHRGFTDSGRRTASGGSLFF